MPSSKNKFVGATNLYKELVIIKDNVEKLKAVSTDLIDASNLSNRNKKSKKKVVDSLIEQINH